MNVDFDEILTLFNVIQTGAAVGPGHSNIVNLARARLAAIESQILSAKSTGAAITVGPTPDEGDHDDETPDSK